MIDLLARKSARGDISINLAKQLISKHEWGLARRAVEQALEKGGLTNPGSARRLLEDISSRLGGYEMRSGATRE